MLLILYYNLYIIESVLVHQICFTELYLVLCYNGVIKVILISDRFYYLEGHFRAQSTISKSIFIKFSYPFVLPNITLDP